MIDISKTLNISLSEGAKKSSTEEKPKVREIESARIVSGDLKKKEIIIKSTEKIIVNDKIF